MSKTLGGFIFFKSPIKYDYNFVQSVISLSQCCDKVSILYFDDECDIEEVQAVGLSNIQYHYIEATAWDHMKGKTKLANFQNMAAMFLDTDYQLLVQADEVIHPDSYKAVRKAMETGGDGFLCERVNLWGSPYERLVVAEDRMPCSSYVNRLTKRGFWCYDDGENIQSPTTNQFSNQIRIVHYGFVRKREVMKAKIINMQENIFNINHDPKLDLADQFNSEFWFRGADLAPIDFEHPDFMMDWVLKRM